MDNTPPARGGARVHKYCDPNDTLHRLREFVETFLSMKILPDLIWWLQPELASKMPKREE
ncbi:MAG: hypothetical protein PHV63_04340 [Candidatus Daviesbacteria bacterium]|nr:hypothetical protein [Candidatus Daviesbacteria bacterium]